MASKSIASRAEIETKLDIGEVESKQVMSAKGPASGGHMFVGIEAKQDMSSTVADTKADLFLDQLQVDVTRTVVVMIGRRWDVNAVTSCYLSTDFVVSDAKGNAIHCTARSNVTHNFLLLKEGGIYSIKNFVVHRNKEEYRIRKNDAFMIEFDGATSIRKAFVKADGFVRYPFQLGQSIKVTLWGALGDVLVEKKSKQAGMCPIVLTSANAKYYNNKLYLSSSSSTLIFYDADIPAVKALMTNMPTAIFHCKVRIANVRTRKGWNFPSCGGENCKKGATRRLGQFWCESCNKSVEFPVLRYRLELDVADDTANAVVVMFDEPATTLVGCSAESIMEDDDESSDDQSNLPPALANLIGTTHTLEIKSHTYYEFGTFESFTCWTIVLTEGVAESASSSTLDAVGATESPKLKSLTRDPSVPTPSKPSEERPTKRIKIEDSESEDKGDTAMHPVDKKKRDSDEEDNCGSAECGTRKKDRRYLNKKTKL
ncbi:replication protein A 70 kDa DNA-binding subunit C-like protein [Tanacetum coccineum]